ncbi:MAG: hypothetical protein R3Y51_01250 [Rikenellaceae bacterium]
MKKCFFSILFLFIAIVNASSQEISNDETKTFGQKLIPHYLRVQYAGSVGAGSIAAGWTYGRNDQWDSDLAVGLVPKASYDKIMTVMTIKQGYTPWNIKIKDSSFSISPLTCGIFVSTVFDKNFWIIEPDKYNPPYYGFPTAIRINPYVGQKFTYYPKCDILGIKSISPYYELSVSDFNLVNKINNSYLKPRDYLSLALGVKFTLCSY